ncbi:hypothetical protein [Anabaena sp. AL93]|jgi:hypothetical protein|uniref:hypothetical protein n=1 Tax=Anabaena sp. AL93 TaxID=1678133 RepID=UPI0007FBFDFA|nr:hypothetical protein [Anabaena sp. AL93]MDM3846345.1 hypothetical protein [Aphanizomenon gracile PMC638.10]MDM3857413.1 hypothetical protein [Aphanizomenon gracile PMC649.10]MDM3860944.1 hypothetical protein [Aphanizomenon gracile PMC644.10]OBQ21779.1 MAG: hypothetical protein AN486_03495 [Anabaena sp. AL93]
MISNSSSPLRLRIWRPCRWNKEYLDTKDNSLADMGAYQECLYSWEPFGDPFGSVTSSEQTQRLREELMEKFALAKPVQERGIKQFKQVISVIDEILSNKDESSWSDSEESRQLLNSESINLRQHQLLALRQHIQWVYDTFVNVIDVNVSLH